MTTIETIIERCEKQIASAEVHIAKHIEAMKSNPHHAMTWAGSAFQASAEWKVAKVIIGMCDASESGKVSPRDYDLSEIRKHVQYMVLNGAKYPGRSSSASSNMTEQYTTAAYSETLDAFKGILREGI